MTGAPHSLTIADVAMLRSLRVWGGAVPDRFWNAFRSEWKESLLEGWPRIQSEAIANSRDHLHRELAAEARPDFSRIHWSWWVRALKAETLAIQRAVAGQAPTAVREALRIGLGLSREDVMPDRDPVPECLRCALALWTERLVGDLAERDDDPPVVLALTRFDLRAVSRLIQAAGLVKWAMAGEDPPHFRSRDRARFAVFSASRGVLSPRIHQLAKLDVTKHGNAGRHEEGRLGLVTFARLLEVVEPYRARWALQHLPYNVAKFARTLMNPKPRRESSLAPWEEVVLRTAWEQLRSEGRIELAWGGAR